MACGVDEVRNGVSKIQLPENPTVNPDIFQLENKPKPVLAHDIGAGAPCLFCKDDCPGLDLHYWRKICRACKCRKDEHDIQHHQGDDPVHIRIGRLFDKPIKYGPPQDVPNGYAFVSTDSGEVRAAGTRESVAELSESGNRSSAEVQQYTWVPPGVDADIVAKYMTRLAPEDRPVAMSEGATKRRQALEYQLPLHDCDPNACHALTETETETMQKYVDTIKAEVVGMGEVDEVQNKEVERQLVAQGTSIKDCESCLKRMDKQDVGVFTKHGKIDSAWHPNCFRCSVCDQLLVDMLYFYNDGKYYCGRHFGDTMYPRCNGCDELIFAKEYTRAEDKDWHLAHFCCFGCDKELGGFRYMVREPHPYCIECYMDKFARTCQMCKLKIAPDTQRISHKEMHWHAKPECFHCVECRASLISKRFVVKGPHIFCSSDCKQQFYKTHNKPTKSELFNTD